MSSPFSFEIRKAILWRYDVTTIVDGKEEHTEKIPKKATKIDVTHITWTSGMIRSGQVFAPGQL